MFFILLLVTKSPIYWENRDGYGEWERAGR
jgi:hypothetical protein